MNIDAVVKREEMIAVFPHLARTDEATSFQMYRQTKDNGAFHTVELTIFYREPGKQKMRIDAEFDWNDYYDQLKLLPTDIKIVKWGLATEAVT